MQLPGKGPLCCGFQTGEDLCRAKPRGARSAALVGKPHHVLRRSAGADALRALSRGALAKIPKL